MEKGIIKQGNLNRRLILTFDYTIGYLNMNGAGLLFLEFDLQMTKTDKV